jgi:hypothetical protein
MALKIIGGIVGGSILLVGLLIGAVLIRKSGLFILRSDLKELAVRACDNTSVASELCGFSADLIISTKEPPRNSFPNWLPPDITLRSWRPLLPMSGTIEATISGVGAAKDTSGNPTQHMATKISDQRCKGTVRFDYRFAWNDNGRSVTLGSEVVGTPTVVKR